jgi:hypothetical protein
VAEREQALSGLMYRRGESARREFRLSRGTFSCRPCYYCGLPATCVDHVPPISKAAALLEAGVVTQEMMVCVSSCQECNSILGARPLLTPELRRRYIAESLHVKVGKHDRVHWTDDEMVELGPRMRKEVADFRSWLIAMRERRAWATSDAPLGVGDDGLAVVLKIQALFDIINPVVERPRKTKPSKRAHRPEVKRADSSCPTGGR